jgi:predicted RNA-binding protein with PIN domain
MNYLIDGHNLIGKLPDIDLRDPDDEAKLVLKLLNWSAVGKNRRVIVVFDGGVPGQQWVNFKSDRIKAVFVPQGQSADSWLIRFMRQQVKNPQEFTLVSSDNAIIKVAEGRRISHIRSELFAAQVAEDREAMLRLEHEGNKPLEPEEQPTLPTHEVDAWLDMFGGEVEMRVAPYRPKPQPKPSTTHATPPAQPSGALSTDGELLSPDEVAAWLDLFGGEPAITRKPAAKTERQDNKQKKRASGNKQSPLSQEDVDMWLSLFGSDE